MVIGKSEMSKVADWNMAECFEAGEGMTVREVSGSVGLEILHKSSVESGHTFEVRQPRYNDATKRAMQEARDIIVGKAEAAGYDSVDAMFADLDK